MTFTTPIFGNTNREGTDLTTSGVFTLSTSTPEYPGPPFSLGTTCPTSNEGIAVYCTASTAVTQYDACQITYLYAATPITSTIAATQRGAVIGVAAQTMTTGQFGWFFIDGVVTVGTVATATANGLLYTSATAGKLTSVLATGSTVLVTDMSMMATSTTTNGTAQIAGRAFIGATS